MPTSIFTLHITYAPLPDPLWRDVEVSSNTRLDRLGFMALATFQANATHLFEIGFRGQTYELPFVDDALVGPGLGPLRLVRKRLYLPDHTLKSLGLQVGDEMEMVY